MDDNNDMIRVGVVLQVDHPDRVLILRPQQQPSQPQQQPQPPVAGQQQQQQNDNNNIIDSTTNLITGRVYVIVMSGAKAKAKASTKTATTATAIQQQRRRQQRWGSLQLQFQGEEYAIRLPLSSSNINNNNHNHQKKSPPLVSSFSSSGSAADTTVGIEGAQEAVHVLTKMNFVVKDFDGRSNSNNNNNSNHNDEEEEEEEFGVVLVPGRQYEYPFAISLQPAAAVQSAFPSSLHVVPAASSSSSSCNGNGSHHCHGWGEIRYFLTAVLVPVWPPGSQAQVRSSPARLHVISVSSSSSAPSSSIISATAPPRPLLLPRSGPPVMVRPQTFAIQTNLLFPRGDLVFGWSVERSVYAPGDAVCVKITGENRSQVNVKDFVIRWIQTVTLLSAASASSPLLQWQQTLATSRVEVHDCRQWMANNPVGIMAPPTIATLHLPHYNTYPWLSSPSSSTSDTMYASYAGTVLRIEHAITVIAQTATDRTTNPRLTGTVYLRMLPLMTTNTNSTEYATTTITAADAAAATTTIPMAVAVPIFDDDDAGAKKYKYK